MIIYRLSLIARHCFAYYFMLIATIAAFDAAVLMMLSSSMVLPYFSPCFIDICHYARRAAYAFRHCLSALIIAACH